MKNDGEVLPDDVGRMLGVSAQKARYVADKLKNAGYLYDLLVVDEPTRYGLSKKGRAFLIEEGHVR